MRKVEITENDDETFEANYYELVDSVWVKMDISDQQKFQFLLQAQQWIKTDSRKKAS